MSSQDTRPLCFETALTISIGHYYNGRCLLATVHCLAAFVTHNRFTTLSRNFQKKKIKLRKKQIQWDKRKLFPSKLNVLRSSGNGTRTKYIYRNGKFISSEVIASTIHSPTIEANDNTCAPGADWSWLVGTILRDCGAQNCLGWCATYLRACAAWRRSNRRRGAETALINTSYFRTAFQSRRLLWMNNESVVSSARE